MPGTEKQPHPQVAAGIAGPVVLSGPNRVLIAYLQPHQQDPFPPREGLY
jgi:hypothetical protein